MTGFYLRHRATGSLRHVTLKFRIDGAVCSRDNGQLRFVFQAGSPTFVEKASF